MRVVRTRVLPVPAPASTSSGPSVASTASRLLGVEAVEIVGLVRRRPNWLVMAPDGRQVVGQGLTGHRGVDESHFVPGPLYRSGRRRMYMPRRLTRLLSGRGLGHIAAGWTAAIGWVTQRRDLP